MLTPSPWARQKILTDPRRERGCCWLLFQIVLCHSSIQLYKCKIQNEKYYWYSQCTKVEHTIYLYTLFLGLNADVNRAFTINFPFLFLMEIKTERRRRRDAHTTYKNNRKPSKLKAHHFRQLLVRINIIFIVTLVKYFLKSPLPILFPQSPFKSSAVISTKAW